MTVDEPGRAPESVSCTFAEWSAGLTCADLPDAVVDKVKALFLMPMVATMFGRATAHSAAVQRLIKAEEGGAGGATVLWDGSPATRSGAIFANCELMHAAGLFDSYRMLTHPGPVLASVALANAELGGRSGEALVTALAVGYEFHCRLARDLVPAISAQGFRPAPVIATMGAALVTAKLLDLDAAATAAAISIAANSVAAGLNEAGRAGGDDHLLHEPMAARQGAFAAVLASTGYVRGTATVLEGDSGFFRAFAGRRGPVLSHVFDGPRAVDIDTVTRGLGEEYALLRVMFRMYPAAGYNQPVIDLIADLVRSHDLVASDVDEVIVIMNYLETQYPSPEFPRDDPAVPRPNSTHYYAAHALLHGGFPVVGSGDRPRAMDDDPALGALMKRITLVGAHEHPMFSPSVVVRMRDGRACRGSLPYSRMEWGLDELVRQLERCLPGLPGGRAAFDEVVRLARTLDGLETVRPIVEALTASNY